MTRFSPLLLSLALLGTAPAQTPAAPAAPAPPNVSPASPAAAAAAAPSAPKRGPELDLAPAPPAPPLLALDQAQDVVYYGGNSWLGVALADVDAARAAQLGLPGAEGAEVKEVVPNSPAAAAGIKVGDVITRFHGDAVVSVRELTRMVRDEPPQRAVAMQVYRGGHPLALEVKIGRRAGMNAGGDNFHFAFKMPPMPAVHVAIPPMPPMPAPPPDGEGGFYYRLINPSAASLGVNVEEISAQLAHYFGAAGDSALLVRSVARGSIAAESGVQAGDVITSVGGDKVAGIGQLYAAIRRHDGAKFSLGVLRHGRALTLSIPALAPKNSSVPGGDAYAAGGDWPISSEDSARLSAEMSQLDQQARRLGDQVGRQVAPQAERLAAEMRRERPEMERQMRELRRQIERMRRQMRSDAAGAHARV